VGEDNTLDCKAVKTYAFLDKFNIKRSNKQDLLSDLEGTRIHSVNHGEQQTVDQELNLEMQQSSLYTGLKPVLDMTGVVPNSRKSKRAKKDMKEGGSNYQASPRIMPFSLSHLSPKV